MGEPEFDPDQPATPPTAPPAAPTAPPAPVAQPATPPPEDEHPDAVDVAGKKFVPVAALIGERKQRQAFQEKAARVDELEQFAREAKPYVEFLKANPDLLKPKEPAPSPSAAPPADPQAELLAKTLDLYTADGKPDLVRANTVRALVSQTAQQIAQQTVAPYQERSAQEQSARNFQVALSVKDANGRSPSPQALAQIWRTIPAAQTADPNVASILALTALGLDSVNIKAPPAAPEHARSEEHTSEL